MCILPFGPKDAWEVFTANKVVIVSDLKNVRDGRGGRFNVTEHDEFGRAGEDIYGH